MGKLTVVYISLQKTEEMKKPACINFQKLKPIKILVQ